MHKVENCTLIGTSHISPESVKLVKKTILEIEPAVVAIELDKGRFLSLMGKKQKFQVKDVMKLGIRGTLFMLFGALLEERLGRIVKTKPGTEMKAAVRAAAKVKSKLALVDQPIQITIKRLFKAITWREKFRFIGDLLKGLVGIGPRIEGFDLRKVPSDELIEKMIGLVQERYPSVYKVLIDERNKYMSKRLRRVMKENPDGEIVAVVGAGHVKGMLEILSKN